ncbi:MAG: dockerin type I repeat-containing protein [Muribaculaceae bacterium]|nr:dockerin type I repeat-containing protein [Muribaculaceae bacterium]
MPCIGSASGTYGYIYNQAMAIGLEPGTSDAGIIALTSTRLTIDDMITTRSSYSGSFQVTVSNRFCNYTSQIASFDFGWGFYDSSNSLVSKLYTNYTNNLKPSKYISTNSRTLSFGSGITSGTYRIVPIYSIRNSNNWHPCIGADESYIEVSIDANRCTITGHGTAATKHYTVNEITFEGHRHTNRDMRAIVNLTNSGESRYDLVYLYIDGEFASTAFADIEPGETGDIGYRFVPTTAGTITLKWSLNDDGSSPFATRTLTITDMGAAQISATAQVLNVIDTENRIIGSRQFGLQVHVTNDGETTYDEDITARLFRVTHDNYGSSIHTVTVPVCLEAHADTTLRFDFDDLVDGLKHFAKVYYYSEGEMTSAYTTGIYTIQFPTEPEYALGDVNGDGEVDVGDVNLLINIVLQKKSANECASNPDINGDQIIDVGDINCVINIILKKPVF